MIYEVWLFGKYSGATVLKREDVRIINHQRQGLSVVTFEKNRVYDPWPPEPIFYHVQAKN